MAAAALNMRWTIAIFATAVLFAGGAGRALACSCAAAASFQEAQARVPVIVRGRIANHVEPGRKFHLAMLVDVAEVFRGGALPKHVRVWGDNGAQCRPYVAAFPIGTEWILALYELPRSAAKRILSPAEYFISICGVYWLRVEGGNVVGNLTTPLMPSAPEVISLERFRMQFGRR